MCPVGSQFSNTCWDVIRKFSTLKGVQFSCTFREGAKFSCTICQVLCTYLENARRFCCKHLESAQILTAHTPNVRKYCCTHSESEAILLHALKCEVLLHTLKECAKYCLKQSGCVQSICMHTGRKRKVLLHSLVECAHCCYTQSESERSNTANTRKVCLTKCDKCRIKIFSSDLTGAFRSTVAQDIYILWFPAWSPYSDPELFSNINSYIFAKIFDF